MSRADHLAVARKALEQLEVSNQPVERARWRLAVEVALSAVAEEASPLERQALEACAGARRVLAEALPRGKRLQARRRTVWRRRAPCRSRAVSADQLRQALDDVGGLITLLQIQRARRGLQAALPFDRRVAARQVLVLLWPVVLEQCIRLGVSEAELADCACEIVLKWCEPTNSRGLTCWKITGLQQAICWDVRTIWQKQSTRRRQLERHLSAQPAPRALDTRTRIEARLMAPRVMDALHALPDKLKLPLLVELEIRGVRSLDEAERAALASRCQRSRSEVERLLAQAKVFADAIGVLYPEAELATPQDRVRRLDSARKDRKTALALVRQQLTGAAEDEA